MFLFIIYCYYNATEYIFSSYIAAYKRVQWLSATERVSFRDILVFTTDPSVRHWWDIYWDRKKNVGQKKYSGTEKKCETIVAKIPSKMCQFTRMPMA